MSQEVLENDAGCAEEAAADPLPSKRKQLKKEVRA